MSKIETWPVEQLNLYPANARKHSKEQLKMIAASIQEYGWTVPVLIDKGGEVIAGHGRILAAQSIGITEVPAIKLEHLTPAQARAYRIADNRIGDLSEWDMEALEKELRELAGDADEKLSAASIGYDDEYMESVMRDFTEPIEGGKTYMSGTLLAQNDKSKVEGTAIETVGYDLSSVWPRTGSFDTEFSKYAFPLPLAGNSGERYSRSPFSEMDYIVKTYMRPGDRFLEICAGWWSFSCTAALAGYEGEGIDIWDVSMDFGERQRGRLPPDAQKRLTLIKGDALNLQYDEDSFDFIYCNPPFYKIEIYGDDPADIATQSTDFENWLEVSARMFVEAKRVLKPGCLLVTVMNDWREKGDLIPVHSRWIDMLQSVGFKLHDIAVQHMISAQVRIWRKAYNKRRTAKAHEYVITFRNP